MEISFDFEICDKKILAPLLDKKSEVKGIIRDSFIYHPFAKTPLTASQSPSVLKVKMRSKGSEIDRTSYPEEIVLFLSIHDYWGYIIKSGQSLNLEEIHRLIHTKPFLPEGLRSVLYHEFGHVYDAIFNGSFGYDKSFDGKNKSLEEKELSMVFKSLWNCYIDGRLANRAPYNYCNRHWDRDPKIRTYQKRAYLKEFDTFKSLLQAASEVRNLMKGLSI